VSADAPAGPFAAPLRVHGLEVSYFTGKLEAYLRYKEIPYARVRAVPARIRRHTGVFQVPAVELPDGRWLCDTTPTIAWLETRVPEPPVLPADPWAAFASRLLEDHGDEWLWRPAMHYRWSHPGDAALLSRRIVEEVAGPSRWLGPARRLAIRTRQRLVFVRDDGVRAETREHVEATYRDTLARLGALGDRVDGLVARNEGAFDRFAHEGLGELNRLLHDARAAVNEMERLAGRLADEPSQLIHRQPQGGMEVPR